MAGRFRLAAFTVAGLAALLSACGQPNDSQKAPPPSADSPWRSQSLAIIAAGNVIPPEDWAGSRKQGAAAPMPEPAAAPPKLEVHGLSLVAAADVIPSGPTLEEEWPADVAFGGWPSQLGWEMHPSGSNQEPYAGYVDLQWRAAWSPRGLAAAVFGVPHSDMDALWIHCAGPHQLVFDLPHTDLRPGRVYDVRIRLPHASFAANGRSSTPGVFDDVFLTFALVGERAFENGTAMGPFMIAIRESASSGRWLGMEAPRLSNSVQTALAACAPQQSVAEIE